jgi:hypothetical protein
MVVVVEGWLSQFAGGTISLSGLKTFRILRPLRVANRVKSVKLIIATLLQSLPAIGNTFVVFFFFLIIFGMLCGTLWSGTFSYRCQDDSSGDWVDQEELCYPAEKASSSEGALCAGLGFIDAPYSCASGETCTYFGGTPSYGFVNFDNIFYSALTLFAACTMEGWSSVLFSAQNVISQGFFLIFMFVIILGNFTIINVMIASILVELGGVAELENEIQVEREMAAGRRAELTLKGLEQRRQAIAAGEPEPLRPLITVWSGCASESAAIVLANASSCARSTCYAGLPVHFPGSSRIRWFAIHDSSPFSNFIQGCILVNMVALG